MRAVAFLRAKGVHLTSTELYFFVGKEKVVVKHSSSLLMAPFIFMHRSMQTAAEYFRIPLNHTIEIGGYIEV